MTEPSNAALGALVAKDEIRELVLLYSRAIDRKDFALLRTLYARDATDKHGDSYDGAAEGFCAWLEERLPGLRYSGHHVCNHLISVDGDTGEGEVYALAYQTIRGENGAGEKGDWVEYVLAVRYLDHYRKEDGRWRFARREVTYDQGVFHPVAAPEGPIPAPERDDSYAALRSRLFARGARA